MQKNPRKIKMTPIRLIVVSFLTVIFIGTVLLICPFSSAEGKTTDFIDALFTATSASCVTGLVVFDTASYWSTAGKWIILALIQIGGLGAMTIITGAMLFIRKRVSLQNSQILMQSAGNDNMSGLKTLVKRLLIGTLIFESAGAALLALRFVPLFGWGRGLMYSVFHSVSAFCNAGFDILGNYNGGASLSAFASDPLVMLTIMALVVLGGLGFIVWSDLFECRFKLKNLKFHSKIVLTTTAALLLGGFVIFLALEYNNAYAEMNLGEKLLAALFHSVTPRTAGFSNMSYTALSEAGLLITIVLMLIGGSPGSTAGGMKTTTFAVIIISAFTAAKKEPSAFKRRFDEDTIRRAGIILTIYILAVIAATTIICAVEPVSLTEAVFEVASAIGTVGSSLDKTPTLGYIAKFILTLFMFAGRIGGLSLALALSSEDPKAAIKHPAGKIMIG